MTHFSRTYEQICSLIKLGSLAKFQSLQNTLTLLLLFCPEAHITPNLKRTKPFLQLTNYVGDFSDSLITTVTAVLFLTSLF